MTTTITRSSSINRAWHLIDLSNQTLGRVSTRIASLLIGKHKVNFSPHLDVGDYVVAINAGSLHLTGQKAATKIYRHHTGHPGGFREYTLNQVVAKDPNYLIRASVKGMLPKNKLRSSRLKRIKIFTSTNHPYADKFKQG